MRGFRQSWKGSVFSNKAAYISATDSHLVIVINHLAKGAVQLMERNALALPRKGKVKLASVNQESSAKLPMRRFS
jgi:hypothetical protein